MAPKSVRYHGWWVVFCCFVIALYGWGFGFYGLSLYLVALQKLHGWSPATISTVVTFYYVAGAFLVMQVSFLLLPLALYPLLRPAGPAAAAAMVALVVVGMIAGAAARRAEGYEVSYGTPLIGGFPLDLRLAVADPAIKTPAAQPDDLPAQTS